MAKPTTSATRVASPKKKRKGIVAKSKTSRNKRSKNYRKRSIGQG